MGIKEQLMKIKDNWLLIAIFVLGIFMVFFLISGAGSMNSSLKMASGGAYYESGSYRGYDSNSLMPNVLERIVVKTASMSLEVKGFDDAQAQVKSYVQSNQAILVSENVNTVYSKYRNGYYTISVPKEKYAAMIEQLKGIGEVQSFNENANDITGSYLNLQDVLSAEQSKLRSYETLYNSTSNIDEKIKLLDRIYTQQNTVRQLELQKNNKDERIDYSQISLTMQEKRPTHANVVFATIGDLWSSFKASLNVMLYIIAYLSPFILLGLLIWGISRFFSKR